jgi:regulator of sirC expression with transglutaminase-like and TPR domain
MDPRTHDERWARIARAVAHADLAEGALLIAAHEYPDLDIDGCLRRLGEMAVTLRRRLRPDISAGGTVAALNRYLFDELGFRGNAADYHDPRNSYLNEVMERRLGIPVSLSVLYIAVGRHLGLALEGVSFPSHFLVKCRMRGGVAMLDPYAKGASLSGDDLRRRVSARPGMAAGTDADLLQGVLRSATVQEILARMLRNLEAIHVSRSDFARALWAADRVVALLPGWGFGYLERGRLYLALECVRAALADFQAYARLVPQAPDSEQVGALIAELQRRAARLN